MSFLHIISLNADNMSSDIAYANLYWSVLPFGYEVCLQKLNGLKTWTPTGGGVGCLDSSVLI